MHVRSLRHLHRGITKNCVAVFPITFISHFARNWFCFLPRVIEAAEQAGALGAFLSGSGCAIAAVTLEAPEKIKTAVAQAAGAARLIRLSHRLTTAARGFCPSAVDRSGIDH